MNVFKLIYLRTKFEGLVLFLKIEQQDSVGFITGSEKNSLKNFERSNFSDHLFSHFKIDRHLKIHELQFFIHDLSRLNQGG